jgi:cytidine deaminase
MTDADLIQATARLVRPRPLGPSVEVASVAAGLLAPDGTAHYGVCIDAACSIGFCAEHAAAAAMITSGASRVTTMVAVGAAGAILPPCGRCRELILQIDPANRHTRVLLSATRAVPLHTLLPDWWLQTEAAPS